MNEISLQWISLFKLLWVVVFGGLYSFGGISNKWLRRYVGPAWMMLGVFTFSSWLHSFHWWYLIYPLLLMASLHLGYGGDDVGTKLRKRAIYGIALGISALPLVFGNYHWTLFGIHCGLCVMASVLFGVFNPTGSARNEETLIAVLSTIIPLFLI